MKALFLIFLGVVLLFNNFEMLPWSIWRYILRLWPLILIFIGLRIILGSKRANVLIAIIGLLILVWILLISLSPTNPAISSFINQYLPWLPHLPDLPRFDNPEGDINLF